MQPTKDAIVNQDGSIVWDPTGHHRDAVAWDISDILELASHGVKSVVSVARAPCTLCVCARVARKVLGWPKRCKLVHAFLIYPVGVQL